MIKPTTTIQAAFRHLGIPDGQTVTIKKIKGKVQIIRPKPIPPLQELWRPDAPLSYGDFISRLTTPGHINGFNVFLTGSQMLAVYNILERHHCINHIAKRNFIAAIEQGFTVVRFTTSRNLKGGRKIIESHENKFESLLFQK